ncbi:MAG: adenylosuccinate synthetase [archaeon]|jgi:adenylosuccinate synthase|nr:adenylosuccinate synthetase [archaeon]
MGSKEPIRAALVGLQWGDEGKAKVVDEMVQEAKAADDKARIWVVRYQGGTNAGHTMYIPMPDGSLVKFVTHAAPSGLTSGSDIAIGPHVAFDPEKFSVELADARRIFDYDAGVHISERTGVLLDYHRKIDALLESQRAGKIGTTGSGIGPFYSDNSRRDTRITFADYTGDNFPEKLEYVFEAKHSEIAASLELHVEAIAKLKEKLKAEGKELPPTNLPVTRNVQEYFDALAVLHQPIRNALKPYACRLEYRLNDALNNGEHIIFEGAQGTMLDVDFGTIPDITSSHLTAPHGLASCGMPRKAFKIYGIEKGYPTRVGGGFMPTLAGDDFGEETRINAGEKGATTGRDRRVGYPDWVLVKRSAMLNDVDGIILTRADNIQDQNIKVCTAYEFNGQTISEVPLKLDQVRPVYSGKIYRWHLWDGPKDLSKPELVDEVLREKRRAYVEAGIEGIPRELWKYVSDKDDYVGKPTVWISIGPARGEHIKVRPIN